MGVVLSESASFSSVRESNPPDSMVDIVDINLNMLVTLDVLLQTCCVTAAAQKTGWTQSAVSHTLAKLRDVFSDDLLVRAGRRMALTPKAHAIAPVVRSIVVAIQRLVMLNGISL